MELFSYYKSYQKNMCAKSQVNGKDKTEQKKKKFNKGAKESLAMVLKELSHCLDCIYVHNHMGRKK